MTRYSADYTKALASPYWKQMRKDRLAKTDWHCERCRIWQPTKDGGLELHHKTYERLGHELPEDVELLCKRCHRIADEERAVDSKNRSLEKWEEARFMGWVAKVYGEDADVDLEEAGERFDAWLERQEAL